MPPNHNARGEEDGKQPEEDGVRDAGWKKTNEEDRAVSNRPNQCSFKSAATSRQRNGRQLGRLVKERRAGVLTLRLTAAY